MTIRPSLVDHLRAQGIELRPAVEVYRERALREEGVYIEHPHECRGCNRVVDAKKLDAHEKECPRPDIVKAYRRAKSRLGKKSAHARFHVRRGVVKPECEWCRRQVQQRRQPTAVDEDWPERAGR